MIHSTHVARDDLREIILSHADEAEADRLHHQSNAEAAYSLDDRASMRDEMAQAEASRLATCVADFYARTTTHDLT